MQRAAPDFEARIYTPHRIAAVVATLAGDGVPAAETLAGTGLDAAGLQLPQTQVSYGQIATVFRNAVRLACDPAAALRAGSQMRLTAYGMYGYALLSSPTRAEAIDFAVKYHRAAGPVVAISHGVGEGSGTTYHYEVLLTPDPYDALYAFTLEFAYAAHLAMTRDLYGPSYGFATLRFAYPEPPHALAYRRVFDCPLEFGQRSNDLVIDPAWVARPVRLPDAVTHAMAREICKQFLADLTHVGGIAAAVRRALIEQMPWRFPNIDSMAEELALNPRTLRRRLEAENTSYRELLAEVRRTLAIEYLRRTRMTTEEIASRLGYSDAANFRHAFLRWTGRTPHEYRVP